MARLLGYWHSMEAPHWPDPGHFVDEGWDERERAQVVDYLSRDAEAVSAGISFCRFRCSTRHQASAEHFDGEYVWPEALAHYVAHHRVRLPDEFVARVLRGGSRAQHRFPRSIDSSWWLAQRRSRPRRTFLTRGDVGNLWLRGFDGDDPKRAAMWLRRFEAARRWPALELLHMVRTHNIAELARDRWAQVSYREWTTIAQEASELGLRFSYRDQDLLSSSYAAALDALDLCALDIHADLAMRVALMQSFEGPIVVDIHVRAGTATVTSSMLSDACDFMEGEGRLDRDPANIRSRTTTVTSGDLEGLANWNPPATVTADAAVCDGTQGYVERFVRGAAPLCWQSDIHPDSQQAADELFALVSRWLPTAAGRENAPG